MRIGSLARSFVCLRAMVMAMATMTAISTCALGQTYSGQPAQRPQSHGVRQALFTTPVDGFFARRNTPYVDAHGNSVVVPASYYESQPCPDECAGGAPCDCYGSMGHGYGGFAGPMPMGAGGTAPPVGYDLMNDVGIEGYMVDQRGPHYFDLRAEAVYLTPDETFRQDIAFTSLNIGQVQQDGSIIADIRLSSQDLDYDYEPGFRVLGRFDLGPLSVLEFGYMGIYDFETEASFTDENPVDPVVGTGNLFSLFSEFGTNPPGVAIQFGPMPESERSITHSIALDSQLQTAEMTYRRYWVGYIPRISGTLLAGFRYTKLKEDFLFSTVGEAALDYNVRADNDLAGFQTGGDIWIGLAQGLRIGAEGKAGIYNNRYTLKNIVTTTPELGVPPELSERFDDNEVAFISEASVDIVADILPSWSIRAGYEILFLNSIVLATENFNTGSPYNPGPVDNGLGPLRVPFIAEQGDQYYHGGHVGIEFIW